MHWVDRLPNLNVKLRNLRFYNAIINTFMNLFPFIAIGAIVQALRQSIFMPDGFFASIYGIRHWLPFYRQTGQVLEVLQMTTIGLTALLAAFFMARETASSFGEDSRAVGVCSLLAFLLFNFDYAAAPDARPTLLLNNFNFNNLFLGMLFGFLIAILYHGFDLLGQKLKRPIVRSLFNTEEHVKSIIPAALLLTLSAVCSYLLSLIPQKNLTTIFNSIVNLTISFSKQTLLFIFGIVVLSTLLNFFGILGPLNLMHQNITSVFDVANLDKALSAKSLADLPHPFTVHTLYETYGAFGGSGMTLALILCILLFTNHKKLRQTAQISLFPSLVNLNPPILIGIPVILNPILLIPYVLSSLASMGIAALFIAFSWMPPAVYELPATTPPFLLGFLGTNGNFVALFVSFLCLFVSIMIYYPFVKRLEIYRLRHFTDESKGAAA